MTIRFSDKLRANQTSLHLVLTQMVWNFLHIVWQYFINVISGYESANLDLIYASKAANNSDANLQDISQIQHHHLDVIQLEQGHGPSKPLSLPNAVLDRCLQWRYYQVKCFCWMCLTKLMTLDIFTFKMCCCNFIDLDTLGCLVGHQ